MKADYVHKDTLTATDYVELNKNNELLMIYNQALLKENQSLKKQLEEYQLQNIDLRADIMIQKKAFPNKLIKDKTFYDLYDMPTYEELLVQQKEFIEYLENEIYSFELRGASPEYNFENVLKRILLKYKSILGEHNG